jgi:hypothetical protein
MFTKAVCSLPSKGIAIENNRAIAFNLSAQSTRSASFGQR